MKTNPATPFEQQNKAFKVAVIGAGPAGLAAALTLQKEGVQVDLFEAQKHVGGLCRSFTLWGHTVDLGPHRFFSSDEKALRLWFQAVGSAFSWVPRQTRIFYQGKYFLYPLELWSTLKNLGIRDSWRSLFSYLWQKCRFWSNGDDFESWVAHRFGQHLYKIFFKGYSEKLWGIPCRQIDPDFAYRKIRGLSFFDVFKNYFRKKRTFVETFAYPQHGTGSVYQNLAEQFVRAGGNLHLEQPVISLSGGGEQKVFLETDRQTALFDYVVSTMPLSVLIKQLPRVPMAVQQAAASLKFRNTVLVYLHVDSKNLFPDNWIYVHSPEVQFGRVTNFSNWAIPNNASAPGSVLCLEYWCSENDKLWKMRDSDLISQAQDELKSSGLIPLSLFVLEGAVVRVPKSYPVLQIGYREHVQTLRNYLDSAQPRLFPIGRYGSFKYNNQDHSLLMGLRVAEHILLKHSKMGKKWDTEKMEEVNTGHRYEEDVELSDVRFDRFDEV